MNLDELTPVQRRMLAVLSDGQPHSRVELHACLLDDLGAGDNIHPHITSLRKILRPRGEEIVCEQRRLGVYYRHIRLLVPSAAQE